MPKAYSDIECPPYRLPDPAPADASIMALAARASAAADAYRDQVNGRADYPACFRAAGVLARATGELATAIADSVACGNNSLS
jgi:hypothetical protein